MPAKIALTVSFALVLSSVAGCGGWSDFDDREVLEAWTTGHNARYRGQPEVTMTAVVAGDDLPPKEGTPLHHAVVQKKPEVTVDGVTYRREATENKDVFWYGKTDGSGVRIQINRADDGSLGMIMLQTLNLDYKG